MLCIRHLSSRTFPVKNIECFFLSCKICTVAFSVESSSFCPQSCSIEVPHQPGPLYSFLIIPDQCPRLLVTRYFFSILGVFLHEQFEKAKNYASSALLWSAKFCLNLFAWLATGDFCRLRKSMDFVVSVGCLCGFAGLMFSLESTY